MTAIRLVFLLFGAAIATLFPFTAVLLASRGFDAASIGLVTGSAALAYTIAVPAWGHLGDVVLGRRRALSVATGVAAITLVVFGLPLPALALGATYVVFTLFESGSAPLADALAITEIRRRGRGSYGEVRLLTSASYAVVAVVAGFVFDRTGYGPAPYLAAAVFATVSLVAALAPDAPRTILAEEGGRRGGSVRAAFAAAPRLPLVLVAIFLSYIGAVASFTFLPLRIEQLGGSASDIALAAGLSAAVEVPGFLLAGRLAERIGLRAMFAGSALIYAVALASYGLFDAPGPLIAARILSGFGWAGATVSAVVAMALLLPPGLQATGQALTATTSAGIGGMVSGLAGGLLYQNAGPTVFFLAGAASAFGGLLLGWAVLPGRGRVRLAATGASSRRPAPSADTTGSGATPAAATMTAEPRLEDG